jgi:hypothetical protein
VILLWFVCCVALQLSGVARAAKGFARAYNAYVAALLNAFLRGSVDSCVALSAAAEDSHRANFQGQPTWTPPYRRVAPARALLRPSREDYPGRH